MLTTWVGVVTDFVVNCNSSDLSIEMVPLIACDKILFPSEGKGHDDDESSVKVPEVLVLVKGCQLFRSLRGISF